MRPTSCPAQFFPTTSCRTTVGMRRTLSELHGGDSLVLVLSREGSVPRRGDNTKASCNSTARCTSATEAATRLGLSRTQLYTRLRKHGLERATAKTELAFTLQSAYDRYQSLMDFGCGEAHSLPATRVKGGSQGD
jgi:hypothetical protein